jgi:hypothetical protein
MTCHEAEQLKQEVMRCTNAYIQADTQRENAETPAGTGIVADFAMYALAQARRKYWFHVNQHRCEPLEKEK